LREFLGSRPNVISGNVASQEASPSLDRGGRLFSKGLAVCLAGIPLLPAPHQNKKTVLFSPRLVDDEAFRRPGAQEGGFSLRIFR